MLNISCWMFAFCIEMGPLAVADVDAAAAAAAADDDDDDDASFPINSVQLNI